MNVIQEIAVWAKKLPPWQSDALRRIFTSDKLSARDEEEILDMLLVAHKVPGANTSGPAPVPFSEIVQESTAPARRVLLRELHSVVGVNALIPGQSIKFALDGLTVIYGENGAGKSGYARVLKHACHAREKAEPILADVRQQKKIKPSATIEISVDEDEIAMRWTAGAPPSDILAEIAVFDSHCARVFIDDANEAVYLPYGLDVFSKLALLCDKSLKDKNKARLAVIPQRLSIIDEFKQTTSAGRFVWNLTASSDLRRLEILSQLENKEIERLRELRTIVRAAEGNPPKQRAAQLRRVKTRFEQLAEKTAAIAASFSSHAIDDLKKLKETADLATKAAHLASTQAFADIPIPQIATDPWRALFDAAKEFSSHIAYPGEEFPVTRDGAVCVLCQQPLSDVAAQRLQRFQEFILDNAARKKDDADAALQKAIQAIATVDVDYLVKNETLLGEVREHDDALATSVEQFFKCASQRKQALTQVIATAAWDGIPPSPVSVAEVLTKAAEVIDVSAREYDKADNPDELRKLQEELAELEDRERLTKHADDVKGFIENKKVEAALRACVSDLDTTGITLFGSELMERAITEQLSGALDQELNYFDLHCVPLQVRKSGEKGKIKHQLTIRAGTRPSGVLSEGEQCAVAIAAFLAELSTCPTKSPIVFDDPVSSLDHLFRERVAKRLVTEARNRQVVVFTHDIVMLGALERECAEQGVFVHVQTIRRSAQGPGECHPHQSRPWHAMSTKDRIGVLKQMAAPLKSVRIQSPQDYECVGAELYGKLREAWERAVEEVLLQNVVQRFRPDVQTKRLEGVSLQSTDYPTIYRAMSKCSTWLTGHDSAGAIGSPFPAPDEIERDIEVLEDFVARLNKRVKETEKIAKTLIEPPSANVATGRATRVMDLSSSPASA